MKFSADEAVLDDEGRVVTCGDLVQASPVLRPTLVPALTQDLLAEAYELEPAECIARFEALGVPHEIALRLQDWHEQSSLFEEFERLMRARYERS